MHDTGLNNGLLYPAVSSARSGGGLNGTFVLQLILVLIACFVAYTIVMMVKTWITNYTSPVESRLATAVTKRTEVWGGRGYLAGTHTSYYVTFEFRDGSRRELEVKPKAHALIVEGDMGELSYQGSRFRGFARH